MLTTEQKNDLKEAIESYDFPVVAFDFKLNREVKFEKMYFLEKYISALLLNPEVENIKDGLSNVLYWGYATSGYRDHRVNIFRDTVKTSQLQAAIKLFHQTSQPKMIELKTLGMPQFSGISFISKIRMFLDPVESAILDKQILKIKFSKYGSGTILSKISHQEKEGQIRPSKPNSEAYEAWCRKLLEISSKYFDLNYRAVDIERGLFYLIRQNRLEDAARTLANA